MLSHFSSLSGCMVRVTCARVGLIWYERLVHVGISKTFQQCWALGFILAPNLSQFIR